MLVLPKKGNRDNYKNEINSVHIPLEIHQQLPTP